MVVERSEPGQESLVLCSGGLDSVVLVAHEAQTQLVHPVYVRSGLAWEPQEEAVLTSALEGAVFRERVGPLQRMDLTLRDVYPDWHWAIRGTPPAYDTPDEDVYLVGRNVVLLTKAGILCAQRRIGRIALGPLAGNPFPDATPAFFHSMAQALSVGLDHPIAIVAPFATLRKADVIRRGLELGVNLATTLSCMAPDGPRHCGECSKCRERQQAFREAGVTDPTTYRRH